MEKLGDSHNFGKFVFEKNNKIFKPRSIFWEKLFLDSKSELRKKIVEECLSSETPSPFEIAPSLVVEIDTYISGYAEKLILNQLGNYQLDQKDFSSLGALCALCFWFGLGDLHKDNVKIGLDENNRFICFPIDIECIFDRMTTVDQTLLVPISKYENNNFGFESIWGLVEKTSLDNKFALINSFIKNINLYNLKAVEILKSIKYVSDFDKYPIRIIPRDTQAYRNALINGNYDFFLQSEKVQLERNEIPFFFRYPLGDKIFYFTSEDSIGDAGFSTNNFQIPSIIKLNKAEVDNFIKLKSSILSLSSLASKLNLKSELKSLNHVNIYEYLNIYSIVVINEKIVITKN